MGSTGQADPRPVPSASLGLPGHPPAPGTADPHNEPAADFLGVHCHKDPKSWNHGFVLFFSNVFSLLFIIDVSFSSFLKSFYLYYHTHTLPYIWVGGSGDSTQQKSMLNPHNHMSQLGYSNQVPETGGLINNRNFVLTGLEAGGLRSGASRAKWVSSLRSQPFFLSCLHAAEGGWGSSLGLLCQRAIPCMSAPPMRPNHPKGPTS